MVLDKSKTIFKLPLQTMGGALSDDVVRLYVNRIHRCFMHSAEGIAVASCNHLFIYRLDPSWRPLYFVFVRRRSIDKKLSSVGCHRFLVVVDGRRLKDDTERADEAGRRKDP